MRRIELLGIQFFGIAQVKRVPIHFLFSIPLIAASFHLPPGYEETEDISSRLVCERDGKYPPCLCNKKTLYVGTYIEVMIKKTTMVHLS